MDYKKIFDPQEHGGDHPLACCFDDASNIPQRGDERTGRVYRYTEELVLAINVALATSRPLLLKGPSGCGKSSMARNLARALDARFYEYVVTSRSQAQDLQWRFDTVRRLADAQVKKELDEHQAYIEPGPLWWIFSPETAKRRGCKAIKDGASVVCDPAILAKENCKRSVLLIDEIDKADPDFANNLLVPIGSYQFTVAETNFTVKLEKSEENPWDQIPLVIITSNNERILPDAFERRCILYNLPPADTKTLVEIANLSFPKGDQTFPAKLAAFIEADMQRDLERDTEISCSIPQFLDAVHAFHHLFGPQQVDFPAEQMKRIMTRILEKNA